MGVSSERVLLVGPRGAGKSTVGPLLAARLGVSFVDTDLVLEEEFGPIVAVDDRFREREAAVIARVLGRPKAVVAAGGGAVLWPGFAAAARGWTVVWLDALPELLAQRLRADPRARPSLLGLPPFEEIAQVALARAPLYAAVAWKRIDTDRLGADAVAEKIAGLVRSAAGGKAD